MSVESRTTIKLYLEVATACRPSAGDHLHNRGALGHEERVRQAGAVHRHHDVGGRRQLQLVLERQSLEARRADAEGGVARSQGGLETRLVGDLASDYGGRVARVGDVVLPADEQQRDGRAVETMSRPVHAVTVQHKPADNANEL